MDIIITLPKTTKWDDYKKELEVVRDGSQVMNFKVPTIPKKLNIGDRCYVCHDGQVMGHMKVSGIITGGFTCTTTGKRWEGNFIQRTGLFRYLRRVVPMKGFQGYKYYEHG